VRRRRPRVAPLRAVVARHPRRWLGEGTGWREARQSLVDGWRSARIEASEVVEAARLERTLVACELGLPGLAAAQYLVDRCVASRRALRLALLVVLLVSLSRSLGCFLARAP
jgi:hypothetical protein